MELGKSERYMFNRIIQNNLTNRLNTEKEYLIGLKCSWLIYISIRNAVLRSIMF